MEMKARHIELSRQLPKTGQSDVYRTGDDGTYQAGWWKGKPAQDNRKRFIKKTIAGDDVVIDRATGLIWAADGRGGGCGNGGTFNWNAAIDYAEGLTFAGFSDWRLPNVLELISLVDFSATEPSIDINYFPNTYEDIYHTSTTWVEDENINWYVDFFDSNIYAVYKAASHYLRCVRGGV